MTPFSFSAGACIHNRERADDCELCSWESVVQPQIYAWIHRPRGELSVELAAARELLTMAHCELDAMRLMLRESMPITEHLSQVRALEHAIAGYKKKLGLAS